MNGDFTCMWQIFWMWHRHTHPDPNVEGLNINHYAWQYNIIAIDSTSCEHNYGICTDRLLERHQRVHLLDLELHVLLCHCFCALFLPRAHTCFVTPTAHINLFCTHISSPASFGSSREQTYIYIHNGSPKQRIEHNSSHMFTTEIVTAYLQFYVKEPPLCMMYAEMRTYNCETKYKHVIVK